MQMIDMVVSHLSAMISEQGLSTVKFHKTQSEGKEWLSLFITMQIAIYFYMNEYLKRLAMEWFGKKGGYKREENSGIKRDAGYRGGEKSDKEMWEN